MGFGFNYRIRHEGIPWLRQWQRTTRHVWHPGIEHGGMIGGIGRGGLVELIVLICHGGGRFVMKVGHQHCGSFKVNHTITALFYLFQRRRIQRDGWLGWGCLWGGFCARPSLDFADEGDASIFGVNGAIVSKEKVSSDESAATLLTFERSLFGVCRIVEMN